MYLGIEREYWKAPPPKTWLTSDDVYIEQVMRERERKAHQDSYQWRMHNPYLALLAPAVILAACTLATAFGAKRSRSDETDEP